MTDEAYNKAVSIKASLKEIDDFLLYVAKTPKIRLRHEKPKTLFTNIAYGTRENKTIECSSIVADRLINVLREYREEIVKEYEMLK